MTSNGNFTRAEFILRTGSKQNSHENFINYLSCCLDKVSDKSPLKKEDLFELQLQGTAHHDSIGTAVGAWGSWSHCIQGQEAVSNKYTHWAHIFLFTTALAQGLVPSIFSMELTSPQLTQSRNSLTDRPRGLFPWWFKSSHIDGKD